MIGNKQPINKILGTKPTLAKTVDVQANRATSSKLFNAQAPKTNTKAITINDVILKSKNIYIKLPSKNEVTEQQFNSDLKDFLNNPTSFIKKSPQKNIYILEIMKLLPSDYKLDTPNLSKIDLTEITLVKKGVLQNILGLPKENQPNLSKLNLSKLNPLNIEVLKNTLELPQDKQPRFSTLDLAKAKIKLTNELLQQIMTLPKINQPTLSSFDGLDLSNIDVSSLKLGDKLSFDKTNFSNCIINTKDFKNIFPVLNKFAYSKIEKVNLFGSFEDIEPILPHLIESNVKINLSNLTISKAIDDDDSLEKIANLPSNLKPNLSTLRLKTSLTIEHFSYNLELITKLAGNSTLLLEVPKVYSTDSLDRYFNHINNPESDSLLTIINSIDQQYSDLKINLMKQVLNSLKDTDISTVAKPFEDILYNNSIYLEDKTIHDFIVNKLLPKKIEEAQVKRIELHVTEINILLSNINFKDENDKKKFMLENSSLINQLIYCGRKSENQKLQDTIMTLETQYLNIPEILIIKEELDSVFFSFDPNDTLIFIEPKKNEHFAISQKYYEQWLMNIDSGTEVSEAYWFKDKVNENIVNPRELFKTFKLFEANYSFIENSKKFGNFIKLLNLGNLEVHFLTAIQQKSYVHKLIEKNEEPLIPIFDKFVENDILSSGKTATNIKITENHFNKIIQTFDIKDTKEQAKLFLSLSTVFTKFSSSGIFGTEYNSPLTLRNYALALLYKANELDNTLIPNRKEDWENRLTGLYKTFSCTAILFLIMIEECKKKCPDMLHQMLPTAWS